MRVLVPFSSSELGGSQRSFLRLAELLAGTPLQFQVWIPEPGPFIAELTTFNIPVEIISPHLIKNPLYLFQLKNKLLKANPELIYLHSSRLISLLARVYNIPCIERINLSRKLESKAWCRFSWIDRLFTNFNHKIIAVSDAIKNELLDRGINPEKIHVIKNSIQIPEALSPDKIKNLRKKFEIPSDSILIINVGRLVPLKAQSDFISIAESCLKINKRLYFLIAGDGPLRNSLQEEINHLNLSDHIRILAFQNQISLLYQTADILLHTSEKEALSNTILEAMAYGLAVVATDVGGTGEIISKPDIGILYPAHDNKKAVKTILELASQNSLRIKMGSAAREHIKKNWGTEKEKNLFISLFSSTILRTLSSKRNHL